MNATPLILYEDADLLVIDKPAGLLVHELERADTQQDTVAQWARPKITDRAMLTDKQRAGIIHRLDADTSGVMVIAKTSAAQTNLEEQFRSRTIKKQYIALVHGRINRVEGTITLPISRATSKSRRGKFVAKSKAQGGRAATTHFVVERGNPRYTLLTVKPETGRTHQIRAHMSAYGHPVVGDREYANRKWKDDAPRMMLHARTLGFTHPRSGQWQEYESALPPAFVEYLQSKRL